VLVTGTGTGVGKTWTTAGMVRELRRRGLRVSVRKPVQSADPDDGPPDAVVLAGASGERPDDVCPPWRSFEVPMTPFMAADALGRRLEPVADLLRSLDWPLPLDVGLVEGVGGVRSPITEDGADAVAMAGCLRPDLTVLVADAGLGTLNLVRLSVPVLAGPLVVHLNRFEPELDLHRRNLAWLRDHLAVPVVTTLPALADAVAPGSA
jgi:dethiobiotin synthetase